MLKNAATKLFDANSDSKRIGKSKAKPSKSWIPEGKMKNRKSSVSKLSGKRLSEKLENVIKLSFDSSTSHFDNIKIKSLLLQIQEMKLAIKIFKVSSFNNEMLSYDEIKDYEILSFDNYYKVIPVSHRWNEDFKINDLKYLKELKFNKDHLLLYDYSSFPQGDELMSRMIRKLGLKIFGVLCQYQAIIIPCSDFFLRSWCLFELFFITTSSFYSGNFHYPLFDSINKCLMFLNNIKLDNLKTRLKNLGLSDSRILKIHQLLNFSSIKLNQVNIIKDGVHSLLKTLLFEVNFLLINSQTFDYNDKIDVIYEFHGRLLDYVTFESDQRIIQSSFDSLVAQLNCKIMSFKQEKFSK
jgi:hypothetical protein